MEQMTVFFATNRNMVTDEDGGANQKGDEDEPRFGIHPADFRVGIAEVEIVVGERLRGTKVDDEARFMTARLSEEKYESQIGEFTKKGSEELFPALMGALDALNNKRSASGRKRSALVFVPGFAYTFQESIERGALLAHLYGTDEQELVPFVFSWPSDGTIWFAYDDDRRDAKLSGEAAGRAFRTFVKYLLRQRRDGNCISAAFLVAHSMGAYALRHAVQEVVKTPDHVIQLFDVAVLPAADEDRDALERGEQLLPLSRLADEVVVYVNKRDKPLKLADSPPRMGHRGPPQGTEEIFGESITIVSCEDVDRSEEDETRHQYYRISPEVVRDITAVLNGDPPGAETFRNRQFVWHNSYRLSPDGEMSEHEMYE